MVDDPHRHFKFSALTSGVAAAEAICDNRIITVKVASEAITEDVSRHDGSDTPQRRSSHLAQQPRNTDAGLLKVRRAACSAMPWSMAYKYITVGTVAKRSTAPRLNAGSN